MKGMSTLNMEIEKLEKELENVKAQRDEALENLGICNQFQKGDVLKLERERDTLRIELEEWKKKANYYEAHYNVNYEVWQKAKKFENEFLQLNQKIIKVNEVIDKTFDEYENELYPWLKAIREILGATILDQVNQALSAPWKYHETIKEEEK